MGGADPNTFYRETVLPEKLVLNLGYLRLQDASGAT